MPLSYKKSPQLSSDMTKLKKEIHTLTSNNIPVMKQIHQGSAFLSTVTGGFASYVHLLGNIFSGSKDIPVIGSFLQMVAMIPKSIEMLSDPKKSIAEKVFSMLFLATIVYLAIAAFIVGSLFAAIVGTVIASIVSVIEGLGLLGKIIEKYQISSAYTKKIAFNELIDQKRIPEDNQFNELFEVRAVELQEAIKKDYLSKEEKEKLTEELNFIEETLKKKNIIIGQDEKSTAFKLRNLYQEREEQLAKLIKKIPLLKSTSVSKDALSEDFQLLQSDILRIDEQINNITATAEQLNAKNMIATEKTLLSISSFSIAMAGTLLSVIGLMMFVSSIAMPAAILGAIVGVGIGLAAISLGKYIIEKIGEHQDAKKQEQKETMQKESILEEALYEYENQLQSKMTPSLDSSHSKYMQDLLTNKPSNEPSPELGKAQQIKPPVVNYDHPVFSRPKTSIAEHDKGSEVTATHNATPP